MNHELTTTSIISKGELHTSADTDLEYDHVFIYGCWRIFYTLIGDTAPKNNTDSNQSGIPDYIENLLYKLETARVLYTESFSLIDPTVSGFYHDLGIKYFDIFIENIPKPKGLVSNFVLDEHYPILGDAQLQGKSLSIRLDRNLIPKTSAPMHELFHYIQFNYTQIANLWFMEGIARWAQLIFQNRVIPEYKLPANHEELQFIVSQAHDAEVFWNRLADLCAQEGEFSLPDSLQNNTVIFQKNRTGVKFVKCFLSLLSKYSSLAVEEQKDRKLDTDTYWPGIQRRSASNNKYIFRAIIEAANKTCTHKVDELTDFINLVSPIAYSSAEAYDTPEIQSFIQFLHNVDESLTRVDQGILISDHFEPFSGTLTLDLNLSDIELNDTYLMALSSLKHVDGDLIINNNQHITQLDGLKNLQTVSGRLQISNNPIEQLSGLNNLKKVGKLYISELPDLHKISEFSELRECKKINISGNPRLSRINGFNGVEVVEQTLKIHNNPVLGEINGFTQLKTITEGSLEIENNAALYLINGFCCLTDIKKTLLIAGSNSLTDVEFLSPLRSVRSIQFSHLSLSCGEPLREVFQKTSNIKGFIKFLHCPISDLSFMQGLQSVGSSFYLHNNELSDLTGLEDLERVGASFSILKNQLSDISQLANLKEVGGMLGLAKNKLKDLHGLENLKRIRTIKWNGKLTSLSLYGNKDLVNIQAISNITEKNKNIVVLIDDDQHFTGKPDQNSTFYNNTITILDSSYQHKLEIERICDIDKWYDFETIAQCAAGSMCHLCRNQKYGNAWRHRLQNVTTLPPGGVDFACPYGKKWSRYGYVSKSQQLSSASNQPLSIQEQLTFAARHRDNQSFPEKKWGKSIDIVYPYFAAKQESEDELRYSLRSLRNLHEKPTVWIIGDRPSWLNVEKVHYIPHEKKSSSAYIDSKAKMRLAAEDPRMGSHFMSMYDDLYLLIPAAVAYIGIPRYFIDYTHSLEDFKINVSHNRVELDSLKALQNKKRPMRNYSLHWPYVYNTEMWLKMYNEFKLGKRSLNAETLYYNTFAEVHMPYGGDLLRSGKMVQKDFELEDIPKNILLINNKVKGFAKVNKMLSQLFSHPSEYEIQS